MSNTRRPKWSQEEITAANALDALSEVWWLAEAAAARSVITDRLLNEWAGLGHDPLLLAEGGQALMDLDDEFWHGIYGTLTG